MSNISPKDNYYDFINNKWLKENKIPDDFSKYTEFNILQENINNLCIDLFKSNKLLDTFYSSGLENRDKSCRDTMNNIINYIDNEKNISKILALLTFFDLPHYFTLRIQEDIKDNTINIIYIDEPTLSLPSKEYYLSDKLKNIQIEYIKFQLHCTKYTNVKPVFNLEKEIAKFLLSKEQRRNMDIMYQKIPYIEFKKLFTIFNFDEYLNYMGIKQLPEYVIVTNLEYLQIINNIIDKKYLIWQIFNKSLPYLDSEMLNLHYQFYGKILSGKKKMRPLHLHILAIMNNKLGDLIGKLYSEKYFTPKMKEEIVNMIKNIKISVKDILQKSWMTDKTKQKGLEKLDNIKFKIGYPEEIFDYSNLILQGDFYIQNITISINKWKYYIKQLYKPPNNKLWGMNAHEVNAYYSPSLNEIALPAGILNKPFFDINKSPSYNYGGIGITIGHEIIHAFDDEGRKFDLKGNMFDWWEPIDNIEYKKRSKPMIEHYSKLVYEINNQKINVNGHLTLGENIADLYGTIASLDAMKKQYNTDEDIKQFFTSYAITWRQLVRDEELLHKLKVDPHSPGACRVNQVVKNIPDFIRVYDIKEGDKMFLKNPITILNK